MAKTVWQIWEETQALLAEYEEWRRRIHEEGIERWEDVQEMLRRFREERKRAHDEMWAELREYARRRIEWLEAFLEKIRQEYADNIHGHPTEPFKASSVRKHTAAARA